MRNALVVLGNSLSRTNGEIDVEDRQQILAALQLCIKRVENPVLIEHAFWAIAQDADSKSLLMSSLNEAADPAIRARVSEYIS
jgi:hypothetical protein